MEVIKKIENITFDLFNQSHQEFLNCPINYSFIQGKTNRLNNDEYLYLLLFTLDNFPQIYVIRFILITTDRILNFSPINWALLFKSISSKGGLNIIYSFIYSYLDLMPNEIYSSMYKYDYIYEKDDDDLIQNPFVINNLYRLKEKMLTLGFVKVK